MPAPSSLYSCIQKIPIQDSQKTDIIYHWKSPAHNCTAKYIGETNRSLKERVSDHRNQSISTIRNYHISTKHPKAELKVYIKEITKNISHYRFGNNICHYIFGNTISQHNVVITSTTTKSATVAITSATMAITSAMSQQ